MPQECHNEAVHPEVSFPRMIVVGVGGGGVNALSHMARDGFEMPELIAVHTDNQMLSACSVPKQVQIGGSVTEGVSTGGNAEMGRRAAEADEIKLRALFTGVDLVFLVVALGGGTGTGAAPVLARFGRDEGAVVLCFATLPFTFEGLERRKQAELGLAELQKNAHGIICMPNERLMETVDDQSGFTSAFKKADEMIGLGIRSLSMLLMRPGVINVDIGDIKNMVGQAGGTCVFACAQGRGSDKASQAVETLIQSPYLERGTVLAHARGLIIGIVGSVNVTLREIEGIMREIASVTDADVHMGMGVGIDECLEDTVSITLLATESWVDERREEDVDLNDGTAIFPEVEKLSRIASQTPPHKRTQPEQTNFNLEGSGKGRFKDVEPTFFEGEDLDIPTFIRRGIKLSK